jgi:hypothetical protein
MPETNRLVAALLPKLRPCESVSSVTLANDSLLRCLFPGARSGFNRFIMTLGADAALVAEKAVTNAKQLGLQVLGAQARRRGERSSSDSQEQPTARTDRVALYHGGANLKALAERDWRARDPGQPAFGAFGYN